MAITKKPTVTILFARRIGNLSYTVTMIKNIYPKRTHTTQEHILKISQERGRAT